MSTPNSRIGSTSQRTATPDTTAYRLALIPRRTSTGKVASDAQTVMQSAFRRTLRTRQVRRHRAAVCLRGQASPFCSRWNTAPPASVPATAAKDSSKPMSQAAYALVQVIHSPAAASEVSASAGAIHQTPSAPIQMAAAARRTDGVNPVMPTNSRATHACPRAAAFRCQWLGSFRPAFRLRGHFRNTPPQRMATCSPLTTSTWESPASR